MAHARGERSAPEFELLRPLGWAVAGWVRWRNHLYDEGKLPIHDPGMPVIAVGNLTFGGTGKTPWVSYLLSRLFRPERVLGVLTRGYGASQDEPRLLAARHPGVEIAIDADRARGAEELARKGVTLAIADDAFQHRRLRRTVDLLLIDARHPFGNGLVLPAGMLREPIDSARRADLIVLTRSGEATEEGRARLLGRLGGWLPAERIFESDLVVTSWWELPSPAAWLNSAARSPGSVVGAGVIAVCAIGNPSSFHRTLEAAGLEVRASIVRRDHHRFTGLDLPEIEDSVVHTGARWIACTEKDLFNLPRDWHPPVPLLVPRLDVSVEREHDLQTQIETRLAAHG